jgi:hypothetical protein
MNRSPESLAGVDLDILSSTEYSFASSVCGPHKALVKFGISYPVPRNPATHAIAAPAAGVGLAASHRKPKRCAVADDVASGRCGEMAADDKDRLVGPLGEKA